MMHWTILLAVEETAEKGGLFDINATLPFMAIQFLVLMALLNKFFYQPLGKAIDERAEYIRKNNTNAEAQLAKTKQLADQYEKELGEARKQSQIVIANAQAEAQKLANQKIAEAQAEAQQMREKAAKEIEQQKSQALTDLDKQIDALSRQILEKLLGPELAK
jgi:F-type H+-transporting ATPase subunit b